MKLLLNFIGILSVGSCTGAPLLDGALTELCPVIGYHGSFCPNSTAQFHSAKRTATGSVQNGVGMTIDLSTGEIRLPALQLTYNSRSTVADEVIVTMANSTESFEPNVHVFRSEQDLINVWEHDSGSWLGGELGHAKDVLHIYKNFFAENQATAITQQLYPLYTLKMKPASKTLTLNQYAQKAVDQLPSRYDAKTYANFMDTWGTHIALETELGGMREQQVLLKNCMWQSPYFTGGLTDEELELKLKQDLLSSSTPHNSYHEERRKITLDHHIGGDANVSDFNKWKQTISSNPALLKILKYIPWYDVVQDSYIKTHLHLAITDRIESAAAARLAGTVQVEQQKLANLFSHRLAQAVVGHGPRGPIPASWEIGNLITLKDAQECPAGLSLNQSKEKCNTDTYITSINTVELTEPLRYERDATTGAFRSIRMRDIIAGQIIERFGPWAISGCSLLPTTWSNMNESPPASTVVAMICADCTPQTNGVNQEKFSCECPTY